MNLPVRWDPFRDLESLSSRVLTIEGERKYEKQDTTKRLHRMERNYGKFVKVM